MNIMAWLSSLDDLLYEVMSWILFLPLTLWRTLRDPLGMMAYAVTELARPDEEDQFQTALSPPLFLILCLLVAHALSLSAGETDAIVASNRGLAGLVSDQTTALLLRVVLFSAFPLFIAARFVRQQGLPLARATVKPAFYAQCYPGGLLALAVSGGGILLQLGTPWGRYAGITVMLAGLLVYGSVASLWFARHLSQPLWRGFLNASVGMIEGVLMMAAIAILFRP